MKIVTQYCDKCGAKIVFEPSQVVYLGKSKGYDLCLNCYNSISGKLADVEKEILKNDKKHE